ncbi:TPA: helix-turn-helix domain-containing protein [Photobacterium damselae]
MDSQCFDLIDRNDYESAFALSNIPLVVIPRGDEKKNKLCVSQGFDQNIVLNFKYSPIKLSLGESNRSNSFLFIYTKGAFSWINGKKSGKLTTGGLVILTCNETLSCSFYNHDESLCIFFIPFTFHERLTTFGLKPKTDKLNHHPYSRVICEIVEGLTCNDSQLKEKIMTITSLITLASSEQNSEDRKLAKWSSVQSLLDNNITDPELSLEFIARKSFVSRSRIQKLFYEHGTTFRREVQRAKLSHLLKNLDTSESISLEDIAKLSGYRSVSSANKAFKRDKGISLYQYRKTLSR